MTIYRSDSFIPFLSQLGNFVFLFNVLTCKVLIRIIVGYKTRISNLTRSIIFKAMNLFVKKSVMLFSPDLG